MRAFGLGAAVLAALTGVAPGAEQEKKKKILLPPDSIYLFKVKTLEGQPADLQEHAGKVALVVNLASQ
jgi:hypothetical protein